MTSAPKTAEEKIRRGGSRWSLEASGKKRSLARREPALSRRTSGPGGRGRGVTDVT